MITTVEQRVVLVLADGEKAGVVNNAKGHLFEQFVARLFELYGYQKPTAENLNVTQQGVELDVRTTHALTKAIAIAECKAYTSNLSAKDLSAFFGKLSAARFDEPNVTGFFIAVPGLTAEANEKRAQIEKHDKGFHVVSAKEIFSLLRRANQIQFADETAGILGLEKSLLSGEALLVTAFGVYVAAKEADPATKLARRVLVFSVNGASVPPKVLELLADAPYAAGLDCVSANIGQQAPSAPVAPDAAIVEVKGSKEDFEYQLPASPPFFIGREEQLSEIEELLDGAIGASALGARVFVLNAQSGWGKSSLSLKVAQLASDRGGVGICVDCRTAQHPSFVLAAMRLLVSRATGKGLMELPKDASFAGMPALVDALSRSKYSGNAPLCVVFDQFENVFRHRPVTREFRDLTLAIAHVQAPVVVGFAWKTDLVAFTEGYPYELRDDIRSVARVIALNPLGAIDVGKLLARLQKKASQKIHRDLAERLREYSQGLPWLFKKLAAHILRELNQGATQDQLMAEALNVERLFESDLAGLNIDERASLTKIAKGAPMLMTDALDVAGKPEVIQTLLHQRLLVAVGERVDVYWDIFRDYLVVGTIPIRESYILRLTPNSAARLLQLLKSEGALSSDAAAQKLKTSVIAVHNMSRDLRQVGLLTVTPGLLQIAPSILLAGDPNEAARQRAAMSLKRHRAFDLLNELGGIRGVATISEFTAALSSLYPAVTAKEGTWANYASALAHWMAFAGLVTVNKDRIVLGSANAAESSVFSHQRRIQRGGIRFPACHAGPVLELLEVLAKNVNVPKATTPQERKSELQALTLKLVEVGMNGAISLTAQGAAIAAASGAQRQELIRYLLEGKPELGPAMVAFKADRKIAASELVKHFAPAASLKTTTRAWIGQMLRGWFRAAGL